MAHDNTRIAVLFVCLGNICRSPSAHGVFRKRVAEAGLADRIEVDSAGTGDWHIGKAPDRRASQAAAARDITINDLRARQVQADDLLTFDYVLAMDRDNLDDLERLAGSVSPATRVALFSDFSTDYRGQPVPDPYFGGEDGFEHVLDMIEDASEGLLTAIRARLREQAGSDERSPG